MVLGLTPRLRTHHKRVGGVPAGVLFHHDSAGFDVLDRCRGDVVPERARSRVGIPDRRAEERGHPAHFLRDQHILGHQLDGRAFEVQPLIRVGAHGVRQVVGDRVPDRGEGRGRDPHALASGHGAGRALFGFPSQEERAIERPVLVGRLVARDEGKDLSRHVPRLLEERDRDIGQRSVDVYLGLCGLCHVRLAPWRLRAAARACTRQRGQVSDEARRIGRQIIQRHAEVVVGQG